MTKWEYARCFNVDNDKLDYYGSQAWELVSVVFRVGYDDDHMYVFKRPLLEPLTMAPTVPIAPCLK